MDLCLCQDCRSYDWGVYDGEWDRGVYEGECPDDVYTPVGQYTAEDLEFLDNTRIAELREAERLG